ncbi:unnamed protein product [Chilo suppressalis]|uniref:Uncharacterized protein n=1 Tax=Chilo suppressalis TaxID=168631 RepID=A0ABN8B1W3_CHISP|nr:unnamed protein product [Chilo suppressalis]
MELMWLHGSVETLCLHAAGDTCRLYSYVHVTRATSNQLSAARVIAHRGYYVTPIKNYVERARKEAAESAQERGGAGGGRGRARVRQSRAARRRARTHAAGPRERHE